MELIDVNSLPILRDALTSDFFPTFLSKLQESFPANKIVKITKKSKPLTPEQLENRSIKAQARKETKEANISIIADFLNSCKASAAQIEALEALSNL
jgi:hypothetical protein